MTERKPPGVSWDTWIEQLIGAAREEGAFKDLPGAGEPIADLDKPYDPDWWVKQLVRREQVSTVPASLELLRKVESTLAGIWRLSSEPEVRTRVAGLNAEIAKVNARATEGPPTRLAPLDIEALVAEWRRRSAAPEIG
jgi:DnaJ-like protein